LYPINTPLKEINMHCGFSEYLAVCKRDLSDQEITEIIDLMNNKTKKRQIYEFYRLINLGYTKFIDKLDSKDLVKIGKIMITSGKINMELFKKINLKGPNQVVWIIKNHLYPLLNFNNFSKKTWIEWDKYKERKPDDLMYRINNIGYGFKIIPKYFNYYSDQDVMKDFYKKFYSCNPENQDISEAQYDFCYYIEKNKKKVSNLEDVKNKIEFWKKVEYSLTN